MANSRRVYITLNSDKEKDRIIEEFLSNSYSEADLIKETLYRLATKGDNLQQLGINSTDKVQKRTTRNKKVKKDTKPKSDNKVLNATNNTKKILKDDNSSLNNKEQIETDNTEKVQVEINSDNEVLKVNELNQLMEFMN
ncbi:hypothetical protein GKZ28_13100 [Clostridium chromiireducens]|uniref:Uncharacterized protein n=1 Tax=Clostridium chromiireducens TaxID=225345 RepID=A0A964W2U7_9CLOT|nr:hypothetical protein [Clostridium chromiireducens]MVX64630.1 hypothetical protein [Clostridium chromiireducens]